MPAHIERLTEILPPVEFVCVTEGMSDFMTEGSENLFRAVRPAAEFLMQLADEGMRIIKAD
jgi:hypothetical protein